MPNTAVGSFENREVANQVILELEATGFDEGDLRILSEPRDMPMAGKMSTPRIDFQVDLNHDLRAIGASDQDANAYVEAVRRGATLVFANGTDDKIETAIEIMNRHNPMEVDGLSGGKPYLPSQKEEHTPPEPDSSVQAGRVMESARVQKFVW